jgi:hypothetical protein
MKSIYARFVSSVCGPAPVSTAVVPFRLVMIALL